MEQLQIDKTKKILVVVESPKKIPAIKPILTNLGYSHARVLASIGHVTYIKDVQNSWKNTGIYPDKDFKVTFDVDPDKYKVVDEITTQAKLADIVVLATDEDREGEAIAYQIARVCKIPESKQYRVTYRSVTKDAIKYGLEHPRKIDINLVNAAITRQVIDKLIGYGLSPDVRKAVGAKSAGRCQSIGLKLVVDRENEITSFVPKKYFDLYLEFSKNNTNFSAKYVGTDSTLVEHFSDEASLRQVMQDCQANNQYIVKTIDSRDKQESPKPPFCTATFQQEASTRLNLKVKDAMACAQKLFEGVNVNGQHIGLITYMRTDATDLAEDFVPVLNKYITNTYGANMFVTPRKGKKTELAQEGHEALRVVDPEMTPEKLASVLADPLLVKVYRLIWQRTVAAAMPNAVIFETTYNIYNNQHKFILTSKELKSPGYKIVYNYADDEDDDIVKETFAINELILGELNSVAKETRPPARYTDASLVKELQKRGVGRPSTYATIVDTVTSPSRGYTELDGKTILPSERGKQLASYVDRNYSNLINFDFTKAMEDSLDSIASGDIEYKLYLTEFFGTLSSAIDNNIEHPKEDQSVICPNCGGAMVLRRNKWGKLFYGCAKYPKCTGIVNK